MESSPGSTLKSTMSFRARLLAIVTVGILCLALTAALTTAWMAGKQARAQMVAQALQITGSLADQSVLALLYGSQENAEKPLQTILSFPGVDLAGIFDSDARPLLVLGGGREGRAAVPGEAYSSKGPLLVRETTLDWYFWAPVFSGSPAQRDPAAELFELEPARQELLGHVHVVMNKTALRDIQLNILYNNLWIGLAFALVLVVILNFGISRLTRPLYQLSEIMKKAERGETHVHADLEGPREITHMAGVFNRMMESIEERDRGLRRHRALLQSEVAIRTQELVQARDAALTANRLKSEFLANMSHELRTPLQAIIGYSDVIKEELEAEGMAENARDLGRVIYNAKRLLSLINNILGLAKIEAGRMELRLQSVDLRELIRESFDTVGPILRANNNTFDFVLLGEHTLEIDREKLLQTLLNLLSNAGKFTRDGTIVLELLHESHLLTVKVSDNGIGLTNEQQQIIFEAFRQVDGSATRKFEGTGLGLAITKRFCELMGGSIGVESEAGRGSTFTVRIPLPVSAALDDPSASLEKSAPQRTITPPELDDAEAHGPQFSKVWLIDTNDVLIKEET